MAIINKTLIVCSLLCICLAMVFCGRKPEANKNISTQWADFDSLLTHSIQPNSSFKKMHCDVKDTIFNINNEQITYIDLKSDNIKFTFKSRSSLTLDTTISVMAFNNIRLLNLFNEYGDVSSIDEIAGLDIDSDSIVALNSGRSEDKIILITGNYANAYGKFSYIEKGLILHHIGGNCFGYLLSGDKHMPGNFHLSYDENKNIIRYLKIKIDTDAIDMDTEETYTITPSIINLQDHTLKPQKNEKGEDKVLIVKSKNYYENEKVKIVKKNW